MGVLQASILRALLLAVVVTALIMIALPEVLALGAGPAP
jgi:hypothetical protein